MSKMPPAPQPKEQEPRSAARRPDPQRTGGHPAAAPGLPQRLRQAGNAALSRLLGRGGGGRALSPPAQTRMEGAFGADFTGVRLHDDPAAQDAAAALGARAMTVGEDVYLGAGAPVPESASGQALLAHELAHVVQQRQAGAARAGEVDAPGDRHEQAADAAARQVMQGGQPQLAPAGEPPALQRQRKEEQGFSRSDVQQLLTAFLRRQMATQGGRSLRVTAEVRAAVEKIFAGDMGRLIGIQSWLSGTIFPGDPAEFAAQVAKSLPDEVDPANVAHLGAAPAQPESTRLGRVGDLVKSTAPGEPPPEQQQAQWRFDQEATQLRKGEGAFGPFGFDVLRAARIAGGLGGALQKPPKREPEARSYPAVEQVVNQIAPGALTPAGTAGAAAGNFADAQAVARDLARLLDIAQQQGRSEVALRLSAGYGSIKDRGPIYTALQQIALMIRDALPHHASGVTHVNVFIGDRLVTRIALAARSE
jgi:hypothetical protein